MRSIPLSGLILTAMLALPAVAQNVDFSGSINLMVDRDDQDKVLSEALIRYPPPANPAKVEIFRQSKLAEDQTDSHGRYGLAVSAGKPVIVLYDGGGPLKPELKMLTADHSKPQTIHVTLLSYRQFAERFGREALVADLERLLQILRRVEGFDTADLQKRFQEFANVRIRPPGN